MYYLWSPIIFTGSSSSSIYFYPFFYFFVEEAERWIVNLIRNAKLDAKIDSQLGHVVMGTQTTSPYEQLIERTKALSFRSQMLQLNVEKKKKAQDQPNWGTDGF